MSGCCVFAKCAWRLLPLITSRVIPGEDCEAIRGKGIHRVRVCASRDSFRAADAARMGSLFSRRNATLAGNDTDWVAAAAMRT